MVLASLAHASNILLVEVRYPIVNTNQSLVTHVDNIVHPTTPHVDVVSHTNQDHIIASLTQENQRLQALVADLSTQNNQFSTSNAALEAQVAN